MKIQYDPANGPEFWNSIYQIPGYPTGEVMPIKAMLFESDAVYKTSETLRLVGAKQGNPLILVMDEVRMKRGQSDLKPFLQSLLEQDDWKIQVVVMKPDETGQVHTDMPHINTVKANLQSDVAVLAVGSGVVADISKHACFLFQQETGISLPFVVFQTANSVSAFTSSMAPVFIDGVKRTLPSRYPDALICDLETLQDAPMEMTVAGVGDMLACFVSLPDWYLAYRLGMDDGYTEFASQLLGPLDKIFIDQADAIRNRSLEGMSVLAKIIALGGLAMSLSHATTPLSGFEHVMSHVLDLQFEMTHSPLPQHGSQVSIATIVGLEVYRHFLDDFDPAEVDIERCYPNAETMQRQILQNFATIDPGGNAGRECWSDYKLKLDAWQAHREDFSQALKDWKELCDRLEKDICPAENIVNILKSIGAPLTWSQLKPPVDEKNARFSFLNASLMRKRLTIGDLLIFTGWDREALWSQICSSTQQIVKQIQVS